MKILNYKDKVKILKNARSLKNTGVYINEDFSKETIERGLVPVINKPTRITKKSATSIDHIITNSYLNHSVKTGIIKSDITDHFPIFLISNKINLDTYSENTPLFKPL